MSVFRMPEGVELDLKVYLIGNVTGQETEIVLTVGGLPAFSDSVNESLELDHIVKSYKLDELGDSWRVMTRAEIADYRKRQDEDEQGGQYTVGVSL